MLCNEVQRGSMQANHVSVVACVVGVSVLKGTVHEGDNIKVSYI